MKILHVVSTLAKTSGGPTNVVYNLANYQARAGHEISICVSDRGNPTSTVIEADVLRSAFEPGVDFHAFPTEMPTLLVSFGMRRWLRENIGRFDLVHVHGLYRFPPTYAAYLARKRGIPYIIRPHGALDPYLYRTSAHSLLLKRVYERWFDRPNLRRADAIQFTAQAEKERASFLGLQARTVVVPNGIDWEEFEDLPARGAFRARLGIGDLPLVLFLGRLHFKKGLDTLVSAFARVKSAHSDAQLVIAGPDNEGYGRRVRAWVGDLAIEDSVHFVGHLDGNDVVHAYVDSDVFALPSYTENFGLTVVEAMACGVPVVVSDQVNIQDVIRKAGAGAVTRCDVIEVADEVNALLGDGQRRRLMGKVGRRVSREQFAWPRIVDQLTREYEAVVAYRSGARKIVKASGAGKGKYGGLPQ